MEIQKQKLIVRPIERGNLNPKYVYNGVEYDSFRAAFDARVQALDDAGITKVTKREIVEAEAAFGKERFTGSIAGLTRGTAESIDSQTEGSSSAGSAGRAVNANTSGVFERLVNQSVENAGKASDGISALLMVFAWAGLAIGFILALLAIPESPRYGGLPTAAYVPPATIGVVSLFQFALLAGFARIIEYLAQIARQTR